MDCITSEILLHLSLSVWITLEAKVNVCLNCDTFSLEPEIEALVSTVLLLTLREHLPLWNVRQFLQWYNLSRSVTWH
jgi:hypothetical protein